MGERRFRLQKYREKSKHNTIDWFLVTLIFIVLVILISAKVMLDIKTMRVTRILAIAGKCDSVAEAKDKLISDEIQFYTDGERAEVITISNFGFNIEINLKEYIKEKDIQEETLDSPTGSSSIFSGR